MNEAINAIKIFFNFIFSFLTYPFFGDVGSLYNIFMPIIIIIIVLSVVGILAGLTLSIGGFIRTKTKNDKWRK